MSCKLLKSLLEKEIEQVNAQIFDLQEQKKELALEKERVDIRLFVESARKDGLTPAELANQLMIRYMSS